MKTNRKFSLQKTVRLDTEITLHILEKISIVMTKQFILLAILILSSCGFISEENRWKENNNLSTSSWITDGAQLPFED